MRFRKFAETARDVSQESSGITKRNLVAELLIDADNNALQYVPRFIQGRIFPAYDERKTKVGPALMRSAVSESTGEPESDIKQMLPSVSDMGELFDELSIEHDNSQQRLGHNQVSVADVYDMFCSVATTSGAGSQQRKIDLIVGVLSQCSALEAKYVTRLVLGEMRIGVGSGTVRKSIAEAFDIDESLVERAIMLSNNAGEVATTAQADGTDGLKDVDIRLGESPLKPMLAKKGEISDVFDDVGSERVISQYKYDGARLQIHKQGDDVRLYTRQLEDITDSMPDVVNRVRETVHEETAIVDAEVVGYPDSDSDSDEPLAFQEVLKRLRRKYDIEEKADEIHLDIHAFDLLYTDDEGSILDKPLTARWNQLTSCVSDVALAEHEVVSAEREIRRMTQSAEEDGHEGVMVKDPSATYEPNKRGKNWLKLKPEGETIDAVVVGGSYGEGERSDFVGSFELAVREEETGELKSVGDLGTGFTDEDFEQLTERFEKLITWQDGRQLGIEPQVVFEVEFEEVQPSPEYDSGYGLRFPRFIQLRADKTVNTADTVSRLENIGGFD